jgi:hypothetical protein
MTHMRTYSEMEGTFGPEEPAESPCRSSNCPGPVTCRCWESADGAYEDWKYTCKACGRSWWVEGIDS